MNDTHHSVQTIIQNIVVTLHYFPSEPLISVFNVNWNAKKMHQCSRYMGLDQTHVSGAVMHFFARERLNIMQLTVSHS